MRYPKATIIILNWNGWKDTIECLDSVYQLDYPNFQVVVVDNGSWDDSVERIKIWAKKNLGENQVFVEYDKASALQGGVDEKEEALENVSSKKRMALIRNEENLGFAGGNNVAIHYSLQRKYSAEYVLLLNNDAKMEKDCLENLVRVGFKADAGVVGSIVKDKPKGKVLFAGVKGTYPLLRQFFQLIVHWPKEPPGFKDAYWTSFEVHGAGLLLRDDLLNDIYARKKRYLDNRLFLYWDEIELCCLARKLGYKSIIVKDGVIYHKEAHSSGGSYNPISYYYQTRNKIILARELLPLYLKILFHPFNILLAVGRIFKNLIFMRVISARAIFCGMYDGYRGRIGRWIRHDKEFLNYQKYLTSIGEKDIESI